MVVSLPSYKHSTPNQRGTMTDYTGDYQDTGWCDGDLKQIHDVADFFRQLILRGNFGAFVLAEAFVDQPAGVGIQHGDLFGHQPSQETIERTIRALSGTETAIALVIFRALILRSLLGWGQVFHLAVIHDPKPSPWG